jgi:hypothetical protein
MNGLADEQDLRLRFDVLTKTKQPELCRYWTTRDRAANVRLFRLAAEMLPDDRGGGVPPEPGVAVQGLPVPEPVLGVAVGAVRPGKAMNGIVPAIPRSGSRKVNGYVKAVLALEAVRKKREVRYDRVVRPLDRRRDALAAEIATRLRALSGRQRAAAQQLLAMITQATASDGAANRR